jgi:TonB family protein
MHRSIHKLWGFGALEDWDELPGSSPLNDSKLSTTLEMVLNRDGTVDKVAVVRASGYLPFDAAAIDVAFNAGPYPDPPRAIRSPNGKIYVHWQFHRDERQCATSGVDYFILDNPPGGATDRPSRRAAPRAPRGAAPPAAVPATAAGLARRGAPRRRRRQPPTTGDAAARLRRFDDKRHSAKMQRLDEEVAMARGARARRRRRASPGAPGAPPVARATIRRRARRRALVQGARAGDAARWRRWRSLPFKTSARTSPKRGADRDAQRPGGRGEDRRARTCSSTRPPGCAPPSASCPPTSTTAAASSFTRSPRRAARRADPDPRQARPDWRPSASSGVARRAPPNVEPSS